MKISEKVVEGLQRLFHQLSAKNQVAEQKALIQLRDMLKARAEKAESERDAMRDGGHEACRTIAKLKAEVESLKGYSKYKQSWQYNESVLNEIRAEVDDPDVVGMSVVRSKVQKIIREWEAGE